MAMKIKSRNFLKNKNNIFYNKLRIKIIFTVFIEKLMFTIIKLIKFN
jgi:hypothetical protein